eukprot:1621388-Rhodomonas_salina.1
MIPAAACDSESRPPPRWRRDDEQHSIRELSVLWLPAPQGSESACAAQLDSDGPVVTVVAQPLAEPESYDRMCLGGCPAAATSLRASESKSERPPASHSLSPPVTESRPSPTPPGPAQLESESLGPESVA